MNTPRQKPPPDKEVAPRKALPTRVEGVVGRVLQQRNLQNGVFQARVFQAFVSVCGEAVRKHIKPMVLRGTELQVAVDSAAWRQQLAFLVDDLRKKTNDKLGKNIIGSVRLVHGAAGAALFEEPPPPPPPVTLTASPEDLARADVLSRDVRDGELATLIAHAFLAGKRAGR